MQLFDNKEVHQRLATYLVEFVENRDWDVAKAHFSIFSKMVRANQWLLYADLEEKKGGFTKNPEAMWDGLDAVLFLRDEILRTTGRRIWGLTFTLYPDGKYDIEYDYTKPDDYDDSNEAGDGGSDSPVADLLGGLVKRPAAVNPDPFLQQALEALQAQTAQNSRDWGLGTEARWNLEMNEGSLRFTFADGRVLQAPVQVVGTYSTASGSFLWGWDHPSVPQPLRRAAQKVCDYGLAHGMEPLTMRSIACSEDEAWAYTAAAAQLDGAAGAYRGDAGGTWVYMVFGVPVAV
ncbi:DUF6882 domain-containing protein [Amphibiibacter pelophylacis]|uniref:Uncharacterized protein n=1 Tax=Amphibiibacter pelophylacis TaxID=1799477 RepID=A0ACC6NZK1_9BURK